MGISAALGSSALLPAGLGFRNLVINGDFSVNQRGFSSSSGFGAYNFDRWRFDYSAIQVLTSSVGNDVPDGSGFSNSIKITTTSTSSPTLTSGYISQKIEGRNSASLGWGFTGAKDVVLSFWVKSSITGTWGVTLMNSLQSRIYTTTYAITSANTWEKKIIYIPAESSGTWATDESLGLELRFWVDCTAAQEGTNNTWRSSGGLAPSGQASVGASGGAAFLLTGVQLEANTQATPFEFVPYSVKLALCQRYYWKWVSANNGDLYSSAYQPASTPFYTIIPMPVVMRARPTSASISGTWSVINSASSPVVYDRGANWMIINSSVNASITNANQSGFYSNSGSSTLIQDAEL